MPSSAFANRQKSRFLRTAARRDDKPDSVVNGHSSGNAVAGVLVRPTRNAGCRRHRHFCSVLLQTGFAMPFLSPKTRCALTAPFHPCRFPGGLFSAALSIASRRPGITRRFALRSPDFPPAIRLQAAVCPARRKDYTTFAPAIQNRSPNRNINPAPRSALVIPAKAGIQCLAFCGMSEAKKTLDSCFRRNDQYKNAAGGGECGGRRGGIRCRGDFRRPLREKCIFLQPVD